MIKKGLFLFGTLALLGFAMHKYYVSIAEIAYNSERKKMEMSLKFIGHDLEKVLDNLGTPPLFLGTDKELKNANDYIERYINQRFKMVMDEDPLTFRLIGKEVNNDDFIYCYLESNEVPTPKKITLINTLLTEIFNEQVNMVYLKIGSQEIKEAFNKENTSKTHIIEN